jgi:hypothetical protein
LGRLLFQSFELSKYYSFEHLILTKVAQRDMSFRSLAFDLGGTGQSFITNQYFEKVLSPVVLGTRPDGTIDSKRQCLILAEVVTFLARENGGSGTWPWPRGSTTKVFGQSKKRAI